MPIELAPDAARECVAATLAGAGATRSIAALIADHLIENEQTGHRSHGLVRVRSYVRYGERLSRAASLEMVSPLAVRVHGHANVGHPSMAMAVDAAVDAALDNGVATAAVIDIGHCGRLAGWVSRATARGVAVMVTVAQADAPFAMTDVAGHPASVGTNPIAFGLPGDPPLILDMATSGVSQGAVRVAAAEGRALPAGVLVDVDGVGTPDPSAFAAGGALLPLGGYKGFGLATVLEGLAVSLSGADAQGASTHSGAFIVCVRADLFRAAAEWDASLAQLRARVRRAGAPVPGERSAAFSRAASVIVTDDDAELLGLA